MGVKVIEMYLLKKRCLCGVSDGPDGAKYAEDMRSTTGWNARKTTGERKGKEGEEKGIIG
jgi:hypothetical protein